MPYIQPVKLFTITKSTQADSSVFQVIAYDEERARDLLKSDGHTFAHAKTLYEVETVYPLEGAHEEGIPFSITWENPDYEG